MLDAADIPAYRIGGSLIPLRMLNRLLRSKNFHELYKSKLVEKILEKQERAEVIKREQERISKACSTNRIRQSFGTAQGNQTAAAGSGTAAMTKTT